MSKVINKLRIRLEAIMQRVGYPAEGVEYICSELLRVATLYDDSDRALTIIVEHMEARITGPFGSKQFKAFILEIDPTYTHWVDYFSSLGYSPRDARRILSAPDLARYYQDKAELDARWTAYRKANLDYLQDGGAWEILTSHAWRNIKPSAGIVDQVPIQFISTPMGGHPGYRRKIRRP